jgi:hypothetical protein
LESVSNKASTLRAAIRRQASRIVVFSGIVRAFDSRSRFTVRSPLSPLFQMQVDREIHYYSFI